MFSTLAERPRFRVTTHQHAAAKATEITANAVCTSLNPVELAAVFQMFQIRVTHTYSVQTENARRMLASRRDI